MQSLEENALNNVAEKNESSERFHFFLSWASVLATVFLASATLTTLMPWLSHGALWDGVGTLFSGALAWLCYSWTLSDKALIRVKSKLYAALGLPVLWMLAFPILMRMLGFK